MPRPRLAGLTARRSRPSSRIAPAVGSTKPAIICRVVVLPQPDGPSSETNSPFSTAERQAVDGGVRAEALAQAFEDRNAMRLVIPLRRSGETL